MRAYSLDLRMKIVESVKKGLPKAQTARRFGVDRATLKRYCKLLDERGTLEPRRRPPARPRSSSRGCDEATRGRSEGEAVGHPLSEGRGPVRPVRGEGERGDSLVERLLAPALRPGQVVV